MTRHPKESLLVRRAARSARAGAPDMQSGGGLTPRRVRVACVGDSITAGYLASNKSMAYPGRLQAQLTARFGEGSYIVSNFGAGGATVQRGADSPYWNRTQFAQWINGTYDVVIMMLGTNDAKMPDAECIAEYIMVMAIGDTTARPKGGTAAYRSAWHHAQQPKQLHMRARDQATQGLGLGTVVPVGKLRLQPKP